MSNLKLDFWKANKAGTGYAAIFQYNAGTQSLWLTMMPQVPGTERDFNHDSKINTKLGIADLGEFFLVLTGQKNGMGQPDGDKFKGLYHTFGDKGQNNTIIGLSLADNGNGYYLSLSAKRGGGEAVRMNVGITWAEATVLRLFLQKALEELFVDNWVPNGRQETPQNTTAPAKPPAAATPAPAAKASPKATVTKKAAAKPDPAPTPVDIEEEVPF